MMFLELEYGEATPPKVTVPGQLLAFGSRGVPGVHQPGDVGCDPSNNDG